MRQIVYFSTASGRQDATTTAALWAISRDQYQRDGLSGILVAGGHRFLEVIEGPVAQVDAMLKRARLDPRHVGLSLLISRRITARSFADWSATYFTMPDEDVFAILADLIERLRVAAPDAELCDLLERVALRPEFAEVTPPESRWTSPASYCSPLPLDRSH